MSPFLLKMIIGAIGGLLVGLFVMLLFRGPLTLLVIAMIGGAAGSIINFFLDSGKAGRFANQLAYRT